MGNILKSLRMVFWMTILTGLIYPLIITGIAQLTMKTKAGGNIITFQGKTVGSKLIAQKFSSDRYFWPRPSAVDYNPLPSGGSNLGPTSAALKRAVEERKATISKNQNTKQPIPVELLYASGSGLDPDITPKAAIFQIDRIAKARGMDSEKGKQILQQLVEKYTKGPCLGFLGEHRVNVLELNLALDQLK